MTIIVIGSVWVVAAVLVLALCESAADADRHVADTREHDRPPPATASRDRSPRWDARAIQSEGQDRRPRGDRLRRSGSRD